jgi:hypothetical protein
MIILKSYILLLNACVVLYVLFLFVIFVLKYTKPWKQIVNLKNISLYTYFLNCKYILSRAMCEVGSIKHGHVHNKISFTGMICMFLMDHHVVKFGYDSHFHVSL